ncbi:S41 family peptidase [uncultured Bacteroides sp.]|uniref:S41 family peptidase n=1 Tax=uncultured Bacteroides sp. TaxID=162156 RepID=UPI002AA6D9DB|nr:S41 family peptidase [uncultured Bacteroides sp.]
MNKIKNKLYALLLLIVVLIGNASCSKDNDETTTTPDPEGETTETGVNSWIESTMRENYLWYADIPAKSKLNLSADPETFFNSLLSSSDGNEYSDGTHYYYSYIESTASTTKSISSIDYSYGFDFDLYILSSSPHSNYVAHLLYVAPDSPASEAGLKRGDWIITMNGDSITANNYTTLYGSTALSLSTAKYNNGLVVQSEKTQLGAARSIEDDPVYYHETINWGGKKIGYLVYNHFTAGQTDTDTKYNDELLSLSQTFKSDGVNEFILDLRYNNGGLLSCAQLLSAILAPTSALNNTFCTLEYNDKQSPRTEKIALSSSILNKGENLNMGTVYILVTSMTASASELVINALKPYMNVVVIGDTTEGKNVGSVSYTDDKYPWHLQPIVCKLYNANNESNYGKIGFTPDYEANEAERLDKFLPFGDTDELLLSTALSLIDGTYTTARAYTRSSLNLKKIASSLDRKASNGVIIK